MDVITTYEHRGCCDRVGRVQVKAAVEDGVYYRTSPYCVTGVELYMVHRDVVGVQGTDELVRGALRSVLPEIAEDGEVTYPSERHLDIFIDSLATLGYAITPIEGR